MGNDVGDPEGLSNQLEVKQIDRNKGKSSGYV
jgi:hypothetical protein